MLNKFPDFVCHGADDRWFAEHPERSHRLRPLFPGETFNGGIEPDPADEGYTLEVLVRQNAPGEYVDLVIQRRVDIDTPSFEELLSPSDFEALLHAQFDVTCRDGKCFVEEVCALAQKYAESLKCSH
jgi:hypothetical protein